MVKMVDCCISFAEYLKFAMYRFWRSQGFRFPLCLVQSWALQRDVKPNLSMFISVLTNYCFCTYHAHRVKRSFAPEATPPKWTAATSDMARGELSITTTGQMGGSMNGPKKLLVYHGKSCGNGWTRAQFRKPTNGFKKKVKWWELISKVVIKSRICCLAGIMSSPPFSSEHLWPDLITRRLRLL